MTTRLMLWVRCILCSVVVILVHAGGANSATTPSVAMVTDLQGKAAFQGEAKRGPVAILADLEAGAQVQLDVGATLVALYLASGDEYVFKGPASIAFRQGAPQMLNGPAPQKRTLALAKGGKEIRINPTAVAQGAIVMRSMGGQRIKLIQPSGTQVLDERPEFRWEPLSGTRYSFDLTDDTGRTLYETQSDGTSVRLPATVSLKPGVTYTWGVSAQLADGRRTSSAGNFRIAAPEVRGEVSSARPAEGAPLSERIAYAAWLDQQGFKDEARKYWQAAAGERPDDPRLKTLAQQ